MTTASDARSRGFVTPTGSDPIMDGDNAITTNAIAATDLHEAALARIEAVAAAKWDKGALTVHPDTLTENGQYQVPVGLMPGFDLPAPGGEASTGVLIHYQPTSTTAVQTWLHTTSGLHFTRSAVNGTWTPWSRDDAEAVAAATAAQAAASAAQADASAAQADVDALQPVVLPDGTDINTLRTPRRYIVGSIPSARSMLNWPTVRAGVLEVSTAQGTSVTVQKITAYVSTADAPESFVRATLSASSWPAWQTDTWNKGMVPDGTNLNTWRRAGAWGIGSIVAAQTLTDLPTDAQGAAITGPGHLEVMPALGSGRALQRLTIDDGKRLRTFHRSTGLTGSFPAWQEQSSAAAADPTAAGLVAEVNQTGAHRHAVLRNHFVTRRGGRIGTGGAGVYCIRIDHWLEDFERDLLPALRKYELPCSIAMNSRNWGSMGGNNGDVTPETLQAWSLYDGFSITNHSATHAGTNDPAGIVDEIVTGQRELQAQLPRLIVDEWHMPGVASSLAYDGFGNGNTAAAWTDTLAGRAILHSHAHASGYMHGFWHELTGQPQIGEMPQGADSRALADRIADVEQVARLGKGLVHLIHGNAVASGQLTAEDWEAFCAHIAAMRDEGRLLVLTTAGESVADARTDYRAEVLTNGALDGFDGWTGSAGWTSTAAGAVTPDAEAALTQMILVHSRHGWVQGSQVELVATARTTTAVYGELTLSVEDLSDAANFNVSRTFTIPSDDGRYAHRLNITIPRPHDLTQLRIKVGRTAAGGPLEISDLHMRPI